MFVKRLVVFRPPLCRCADGHIQSVLVKLLFCCGGRCGMVHCADLLCGSAPIETTLIEKLLSTVMSVHRIN
jgi:hypothetical protein